MKTVASLFPKTPLTRGFCLVLSLVALGACKPRDKVTGSAELPASFGALANSSGCPRLAGVYSWPPVEGAPQGYEEGGVPDHRKHPDFFGLNVQERGDLTLAGAEAANKRLTLDMRPRVSRAHGSRVTQPTSRRFLENQYHCKNGWLVTAEYFHPHLEAPKEYGAPVSLGAKFATLAGGDLAIGQWLRIDGGKDCLFPWGGSCGGPAWIPVADEVRWYWSRYRRITP